MPSPSFDCGEHEGICHNVGVVAPVTGLSTGAHNSQAQTDGDNHEREYVRDEGHRLRGRSFAL